MTELSNGSQTQRQAQGETLPERRAWVRYPTTLDGPSRPRGASKEMGRAGRVINVSAGGIGLLLRRRFRPGTVLTVEIKSETGALLRTVDVRVVHTTTVRDDLAWFWLHGCAFDRPLSENELRVLVQGEEPP